jgi:hypothetical protein
VERIQKISDKIINTPEITTQSFAGRIVLSELAVNPSGKFIAYNDDDMFARHAIAIYGSIQNGLTSANIER